MASENGSSSPPEVTAIHNLSTSLRTTAFFLAAVTLLTAIVLYVYKPAVNNDDLFNAIYTPSIATTLVTRHGDAVEQIFRDNLNSFDSPYDSMAKAFLRSPDPAERSNVLLKFFNTKNPAQRQYLLLFAENESVRRALNEYLEQVKSRWQTFPLPVLGVQITRNEGVFYLCLGFAALHFYYTVKHRYLMEIRQRFPKLEFLPDPSILSATPGDLVIFGRPWRVLIYGVQESILIVLPIAFALAVGIFFFKITGADFNDYTRTFVGFVICSTEAAVAATMQLTNWHRLHRTMSSLFEQRTT
jgi:hypothetical protein